MNQFETQRVQQTLTALLLDTRTREEVSIERLADAVDQAAADDSARLAAAGAEAKAARRQQVRYALDRLACGEYGLCEECGTQIQPQRLSAVPWATLCVPCKEHDEESPAARRDIAA